MADVQNSSVDTIENYGRNATAAYIIFTWQTLSSAPKKRLQMRSRFTIFAEQYSV